MDILKKLPLGGWRFKIIGYVALFTGVAGTVLAWLSKGAALDSLNLGMGLPMLMAPYLVVPRVKERRIWQGFAAGILSGVIAYVILLVVATAKYTAIGKETGVVFAEFAVGAFVTAWLSSAVSKWTDKHTAKREHEKGENRLREIAEQHKDRYRIDKDGNIERIHKKRRKKR